MVFIDQQVVSGVFASTCVLSGDIWLEFDLNKNRMPYNFGGYLQGYGIHLT